MGEYILRAFLMLIITCIALAIGAIIFGLAQKRKPSQDYLGDFIIKESKGTLVNGILGTIFCTLLLCGFIFLDFSEYSHLGMFFLLFPISSFVCICVYLYIIAKYYVWEIRVENGILRHKRVLRKAIIMPLTNIARVRIIAQSVPRKNTDKSIMYLYDNFDKRILTIRRELAGYELLYQRLLHDLPHLFIDYLPTMPPVR